MANLKILLISALMVPAVLYGQATNAIVAGVRHAIDSEIMGREIEYRVHLPANYDRGLNRYPVLYITDGGEHFFLASGTTEFMGSQFVIPELIVVAIFHQDRKHDLTPTHCTATNDGFESDGLKVSGGGEKFLQFIEKELIPGIERDYRTAPYRILSGHSLGGLFAMYAYLTRNDLFNAFIAMDPALNWDHHLCERMLKTSTFRSPNLTSKLYMSSAHNAPYGERDRSPFRLSQDSFFRELKAKQVPNTRHEYFEDQNHMTVPYESLYKGLRFIFPGFYILDDPQFALEVPFVEAFYEKQSGLYGIAFTPPERLMEMLGNYFLYDVNDYHQSKTFFEFNTAHYPNSSGAFECLAKAYEAMGDTVNASLSLEKALEVKR
ncbi:MAG TPA: alpha/beta hydrolase [Bacteroides sp.]|nr:alpha/beta hydrolase [Bacteroides sp.]